MPAPVVADNTPLSELRVLRDEAALRSGLWADAELARQALEAPIAAREALEGRR